MAIIPQRNLEDLAREFGLGKYASSGTQHSIDDPPISGEFAIENLHDRYRLQGIPYNGEIYVVDWSKKLLDNGNKHTQEEWVQLLQNQEFQLPNTHIYHVTCSLLYQHKEGKHSKLVKKLSALFRKDFKDNWMMTSTRVKYNQSDPDKVIHDFKTVNETSVDATFVGPDGYIVDNSFEDEMNVLLGAGDRDEINSVYNWISGKKPYLWRINSRPSNTAERAVVLGVYYGRFLIYAIGNIGNLRPARGVVVSVGR